MDMNSKLHSEFIEANMLTDEDFKFDGLQDAELDFNLENDDIWRSDATNNDDADILVANLLGLKREDPLSSLIKLEHKPPSLSPSTSTSSDHDIWMQNDDIPAEITIAGRNILEPAIKLEVLETPPDTPPSMEQGTPPSPAQIDMIALSTQPSTAPVVAATNSVHPTKVITVSASPAPTFTSKIKIESTNGLTTQAHIGLPQVTASNTGGRMVSQTQPLVLSAEELSRLTMQGIVKIAPADTPQPIAAATPLQVLNKLPSAPNGAAKPVTIKNTSTALTPILPSNITNLDPKALKRQQRLIKNRESACLSRKKKREYLQKLECDVADLNVQNAQLRIENQKLKERVSELEKENQNLRKGIMPKNMKTATCLFAVVFMVTLNLAPFSGLLASESEPLKHVPDHPSRHSSGRSLLWMQNIEQEADSIVSRQFMPQIPNLDGEIPAVEADSDIHQLNATELTPKCPMFINKTESLRLENELRGWVLRVEKQRETSQRKKMAEKKKKLPKLQAWIRGSQEFNAQKPVWYSKGQNELQIYEGPRTSYEDLLKVLERREDTFYFVSFSGDHLLLPATAHNKTQRPKMSLVMPAMTFNETMEQPEHHVSMMQIDCEVMNTKMVFVKESLIPPHLLQKENRTSSSSAPISPRPASKVVSESSGTKQTKLPKHRTRRQNP